MMKFHFEDEQEDFNLLNDDELDTIEEKPCNDSIGETDRACTRQKSEASTSGRNDIDFDSFGGSINVFADDEQNGVEVGLNSSSRGNIYYIKDIKRNDDEDYTTFYRRCSALANKDKQELLKRLKPVADELDRKVQAIMQQLGYKKK